MSARIPGDNPVTLTKNQRNHLRKKRQRERDACHRAVQEALVEGENRVTTRSDQYFNSRKSDHYYKEWVWEETIVYGPKNCAHLIKVVYGKEGDGGVLAWYVNGEHMG